MSYRDEREALLAENAALRRTLADAGGTTKPRAKLGSRLVWIVATLSMSCVAMLLWARVRWDQAGDDVRARLASTRTQGPAAASPSTPAAPLLGFTGTVTRRGTVIRAQRAGVQRGARCWVNVTPTTDHRAYNCHVQVECDPGVILYGQTGMGHGQCEVEGGAPVRMMDPFGVAGDHDPVLDLDLAAGRVNIDDGRHGLSMSVGIRLD
jgi:hypothetical protein